MTNGDRADRRDLAVTPDTFPTPPSAPSASENLPDNEKPGAGGPRAEDCGAAPAIHLRGTPLYAFSHPDFTVGSGVSPDRALVLPRLLAGCTAGQDLAILTRRPHQTPKALQLVSLYRLTHSPSSPLARPIGQEQMLRGRTLRIRRAAELVSALPTARADQDPRKASLTRSKKPRLFGCWVTSLPRLCASCSKRSRWLSDSFFGTTTWTVTS